MTTARYAKSDAPSQPGRQGPTSSSEVGRFQDRLAEGIGARSVRDLARAAGISESVLRQYLKGKSEPTRPVLLAIAEAVGISIDWLMRGEGPMRPGQPLETPNDEFGYVPLIAAEVAAGQGREVYSEHPIAMLAFRKDWLNTELRVKAGNLAAMTVQGESMEPTFSDGDVVLVDRSATEPAREGVYVLRMDNGLLVKRLQLLPDGQVEARSDHQAYKPFTFDWPAPPHRLAIIGRVVWVGHKL